jgi:hypothetical protein
MPGGLTFAPPHRCQCQWRRMGTTRQRWSGGYRLLDGRSGRTGHNSFPRLLCHNCFSIVHSLQQLFSKATAQPNKALVRPDWSIGPTSVLVENRWKGRASRGWMVIYGGRGLERGGGEEGEHCVELEMSNVFVWREVGMKTHYIWGVDMSGRVGTLCRASGLGISRATSRAGTCMMSIGLCHALVRL